MHAAKNYGTHEHGHHARQRAGRVAATSAPRRHGVADKVDVIVDDYRNLPAEKYDKITCLEMAEHVGIKNFQKFLLQVRSMLKDDGIFYLQIAGLRRPWQFEDLVWGLFMAKYIFPGADASCPLGFVVVAGRARGLRSPPRRELRRALLGDHPQVVRELEAQRGRHRRQVRPALVPHVDDVPRLVGDRRRPGWLDGVHDHHDQEHQDRQIDGSPDEAKDVAYSRQDRWIGPDPVATQQ